MHTRTENGRDINYSHLSDIDLLDKLIGVRESRRLYRGSLQHLFAGNANAKCAIAVGAG